MYDRREPWRQKTAKELELEAAARRVEARKCRRMQARIRSISEELLKRGKDEPTQEAARLQEMLGIPSDL